MTHPHPISPLQALRKDWFFWTLLLLLAGLTAVAPAKIASYPALVDWPTIATLAGLLVLTKGVELSGYLHHLGERLLVLMPTERALALFLVLATALLSMLLTNDVALFVVVPLTVSLRMAAAAPLPITRLIIFEALAANAGSALTPSGNPQNLFLWQQSHLPFQTFVLALLPLFLLLMVPLLVLTTAAFAGRVLQMHQMVALPPVRRLLLWLSLALYLPFLILAELHHAPAALLVLLAIFLLGFRKVLARVDWGLILVFMLMFIDLRLLAQLDLVRDVIGHIGLAQPGRLYLAGIAASQFISNVPAAILLAEYTRDWRLTAYAVNVGGFGFMLGSLANIIALRMTHQRSAWLVFHLYSLPFLLVSGGLVYWWLFVR